MLVSVILLISGCTSAPGIGGPTQNPPVAPTPAPSSPVSPAPTAVPAVTLAPIRVPAASPQSGSLGSNPTPTPSPAPTGTPSITPTPGPTVTPVISGQATDWGTDRDTYSRGAMATGWTYITNNGNVPITQIDFSVSVKRYLFGFPVEKSYTYSKTGLNIAPGEKQKVEFSQSIPAEYSGMSTAGDYQFAVSATLDGKEIGSFTKDIKVI